MGKENCKHLYILFQVQHQLKLLQQQYQERVDKKEALKKHKIITALRIERSGILTTALSSEKVLTINTIELLIILCFNY